LTKIQDLEQIVKNENVVDVPNLVTLLTKKMPTQRQLFLKHVAQTSPEPMMIDVMEAQGCIIHGRNGMSYIDLNAGISVCSLGHCHPAIVKAVQDQASQYMHTMVYGEHLQTPQIQLASKLSEMLPSSLSQVYFVNSGSEAVEGAMKLAKRYTGRYEIVSSANAYHGSTHGADSLRSDQWGTGAYRPLVPGISHITFNDMHSLEMITKRTACVITEVIQAEAGIFPANEQFLRALRQKCDETGTLLIFDEIQTGYGRTGSLFAFEKYGVVPDVLLLAKAMGGGMPIGAFVSSPEIMKVFTHHPVLGHITTFGGHPVCCAAGYAMLNSLIEEQVIDSVLEKEKLFHGELDHPEVEEIRSAGLMMAVQLKSEEVLMQVVQYCWGNGVLLDWFLFNTSALRISPPLIISEDQIKKACSVIRAGLDAARK
jgi:acetylornithine/succinyldiaminopimelate/putrescine aminotransferase